MLLQKRSYQKELLDRDSIPKADLYRNLYELNIINTILGGHKASRKGLQLILDKKKEVFKIMDIGFGGGDFIRELSLVKNTCGKGLFFFGVDLKQECVNYAEENLKNIRNKILLCEDYKNLNTELLENIDVIHCSLFLHHLTEEEIVQLFKFSKTHNCTLLINDLHRHWLAYYSIKFLTSVFSKSYLVKNDAPLSVKRGFKKNELKQLLHQAGYANYSIKWNWAFRYIITAE